MIKTQRSSGRYSVLIPCLMCTALQTAGVAQQPQADLTEKELRERFGEQQFSPQTGFLIRQGQALPDLVWEQPKQVARVVQKTEIPTRWFNEDFQEIKTAAQPGRYYAYGAAPVPSGPPLRRAMTCCCVPQDFDLSAFAKKQLTVRSETRSKVDSEDINALVHRWRSSEEGAVELAALLETGQPVGSVRKGQWQMENATQHVRLKRKLMGWDHKPLLIPTARRLPGEPAPVLRTAPLAEAGITDAQVQELERRLAAMYEVTAEPMAVVVAHKGVIVLAKGYGKVDGQPVTIDTPMRLDSAMKPLIGVQLAMSLDHGFLKLDEPMGNYLPDFNTPRDRHLTFRAGHTHTTGIHFPWDLAFRRLFYFHTWHESLIAHCKREWEPGTNYRYGVVGVILSVRALELLRGRNYWDAMERDLFKPLGIHNVLPGGTGFSAESMARIGVLMDNRGRYGPWQLFSEETCDAILPTSLKPHFPALNREYGIGFQNRASHLGPSSYGHGGGCGTQFVINPQKHLVFAMVRNAQGKDFKTHLSQVMAEVRGWEVR